MSQFNADMPLVELPVSAAPMDLGVADQKPGIETREGVVHGPLC